MKRNLSSITAQKYFSDQIGTTKGQNNVDYEIIHIRLQIFLKKIKVEG